MNSFINNIQQYINSVDEKSFKRVALIFLGLITLLCALLMYRYFSSVSSLKGEWASINKFRKEAQIILTRNDLVSSQKDIVDEILKKEKNFRLMQYLDETLNSVGLKSNKGEVKGPQISKLPNQQNKDYVEVRVDFTLREINTKQLVDFLNE